MSLYDIARYVDGYLHRWDFPVVCQYDNDRITAEQREGYADRVILSHDRSSGDRMVPVSGSHGPRRFAQLEESALIWIFAQSPEPGARTADHEIACKLYRDAVICGVLEYANTSRVHSLRVDGGRFLSRSERGDVEAWAGAVYELRLLFPHPIEQRKYPGGWKDVHILQAEEIAPTILTTARAGAPEEP